MRAFQTVLLGGPAPFRIFQRLKFPVEANDG